MNLSPCQQSATDAFLTFLTDETQSEFALIGAAGRGKSFLTKHLIESAVKHTKFLKFLLGEGESDLAIELAATTHKAVAVLSESTGKQAKTIHSLLGLKVFNNFQTGSQTLKKTAKSIPIENTILFIDESSMVDTALLQIIRELTLNCKIVFIGDTYQLSPVMESNCPVFNSVDNIAELIHPMRQAMDSEILPIAESVRLVLEGKPFPKTLRGTADVIHLTGDEFREAVTQTWENHKSNPSTDAKILCWSNDQVKAYSKFIRDMVYGVPEFCVGEVVTTNKPLIMNGVIAAGTDKELVVTNISEDTTCEGILGNWYYFTDGCKAFQAKNQKEVVALKKLHKKNKDWVDFFRVEEFFADLRPTFSCTVHKSQGSTYDKVFIDLNDIGRCNIPNDVARLLYVAITRAKSKVYLYGELPEKYVGT